MPDHWQSTTLGEIADYLNGFPFKPDHLSGNALPVIRIRQLVDAAEVPDRTDLEVPDKHQIDDGDIVFSWSATLAVRIWDRGPALLNQHLFKVVPSPGVESRWVALALEHSIDDLAAKSHGTTMKHITKKSLSAHAVRVPPPAEQRRIVDLVGSIDAYIDALEAQIDTTRTARTGVLSELLSNPGDDWQSTTLGEVCELEIGRTPPRKETDYWTSSLERPFCTIADMDGRVIVPDREGVTEFAEQDRKARRVEAGSLLMSFKLTIGRVAFAGCDLFPNEAIVAITPDEGLTSREFLYLNLGSRDLTEGSGQAVKGKTLNSKSLRAIELDLPPLAEQRRIVDLVGTIDEQIKGLESQVAAARDMRSGVLSELLSGERLLTDDYEMAVGL